MTSPASTATRASPPPPSAFARAARRCPAREAPFSSLARWRRPEAPSSLALDRACDSANLDDAGLRPGDVLVPAARGGAVVAAFAPPAGRSPLPRAYFLERGHLDILVPDRTTSKKTCKTRVAFTLSPGAFFTHPLSASLPGVPDDAEVVVATPGVRVHACALDRLRAAGGLRLADGAYAELRETATAYVPAFRALEKTGDGAWTARLVSDLFEAEEHAPRGSSRAWATPKMRFASSFEARWSRRV